MAAASASVTTYMDERVARRVVGGKRLDSPEFEGSYGSRSVPGIAWGIGLASLAAGRNHISTTSGGSTGRRSDHLVPGGSWTCSSPNLLANKT